MKRPSLQWYPGDFRRDTAVQSCSFDARALWREMLDIMHDGEPYGHLTAGGLPIEPPELSRMVGLHVRRLRPALEELERKNVFSRTAEGVIYSRRMVRDEQTRQKRAAGGAKGGNPALVGTGKDKGKDNHEVNLPPNLPANLGPTPASAVCSLQFALPGRPQDPGDTETPSQPPAVAPARTGEETPPAADGQAGDWRHKVSDPQVKDPDLVAEMQADADGYAETVTGMQREHFTATADGLISGDSMASWRHPAEGGQVPWADRPRLFREAIRLLKAGERRTIRAALTLALQHELDPKHVTTAAELGASAPPSRNGKHVDELPGGDRAGQRGTSHDLQPMGKPEGDAVLERQQEEKRLISAYLEEHPDERTDLERQVESWLKSIPGADKLPAVIVSGKTAGKLRELVLERIRLRTPALA